MKEAYARIEKEIAEREKSILASVLEDSIGTVLTTDVTEKDFDDGLRVEIFKWSRDCAEKGIWFDTTTAELDGGFPGNMLKDFEKVWIPASAIQHTADKMRVLRRVRDWSRLLYRAASELLVDRQVDFTLGRLHQAETKEKASTDLRTNKEVLSSAFDEMKLIQEGGRLGRLPMGHARLNLHAPGPGEVLVIGGDSSMGKSLLASRLAEYMTCEYHDPIPCLFVSLEMSEESITWRKFAEAAGVDVNTLRTKEEFHAPEYDLIQEYIDTHQQAPLFWQRIESPDVLISTVTRLCAQYGIGAVFIDYLQNMDFGSGSDRYDLRIGEAMRRFYANAKKTGVAYIILSQLRKKTAGSSQSGAPSLQDLKETGVIRQMADEIWLLHRPAYGNPSESDQAIHVRMAKDRDGPAGEVVRLEFENGKLLDWAGGAGPRGQLEL